MKHNNLRISNIVFTGKMPFTYKLKHEEVKRLILEAGYFGVNEEISPIFSKRVKIRDKIKLSVQGKEKQPYVSIWTSGAINIVGVINRKEANQVYDIVLKDIKKYCKRVLKESPHKKEK